MNPYEPQLLNSNPAHVESVETGSKRRFRWSTFPATLSGFFGVLALVVIPIGVFQNREVYQEPSSQMMFVAAISMPIALLASGVLNVVAGLEWFRGRWLTALICNVAACGTMMIPTTMLEAAMDAAKNVP